MVHAKTIPYIPIWWKKRKWSFVRVFHFPGAVKRKERRQRWKRLFNRGEAFVCMENNNQNKEEKKKRFWYSFTSSVLTFSIGDEFKLFTVFKIDWKLVSHELSICLKRWRCLFSNYGPTRRTNCSTAEAIPTNEVIKYLLAKILCLQICFKFCHIHSVEIGSNFVFCCSKL